MPDTNAEILTLKNANVRWFLSVNMNCIPNEEQLAGKRTFRSIIVDGKEIEFSGGFADLHTRSYEEILKGNGFGLSEAYRSIETVSAIRNLKLIRLKEEYYPFCKKAIGKTFI
jgi:UDP-N-acetyl-2-amino-2-deoxyglucuronate dehydrogenase